MGKLITTLSLGAILASSSLFAADRPESSDATNLQDAVTTAQDSLSDLKSRFQGKPGFYYKGGDQSVKVEVGNTANSYDKDILEKQLPKIEDYLESAAEKLGDAAEKLPTNEGYTIFYQGCGDTRAAKRQVDVVLTKVKHSVNFVAEDFTGIQADIERALVDSKCL